MGAQRLSILIGLSPLNGFIGCEVVEGQTEMQNPRYSYMCGMLHANSIVDCTCVSSLHISPVVGANQNHLGALLCENSQTNLGHQVAKVCSVNQPLRS